MTAKQYLHQAYLLNDLIQSNINEFQKLQVLQDGLSAINYSSDHVTGSGMPKSQIEMTIQRIESLKEQINRESNQYIDLIHEIHTAISCMTDNREKLILRKRYIEFKPWSEIQTDMQLEKTQVFNLHLDALNHFKVPEKVN